MRLAAGLALLALLAGCKGSTPSADQARVDVMKADSVLAHDKDPSVTLGSYRNDNFPPRRNDVVSTLESASAADARRLTADTMRLARAGGWTIFYANCDAAFEAFAYKVADGVSYHLLLDGRALTENGISRLTLNLIAPQSREPVSDLVPERPRAIDTTNCIESAGSAAGPSGTKIVIDREGPDPSGKQPKPPGHR